MDTLPLREPAQSLQQLNLEQHNTDTTTPERAESPSKEPFAHHSSPIRRNESLTHENLFLLDNSLVLTDNGHDVCSDAEEAQMNEESYVSFPSSHDAQSRANSIVSSAIMSTSTAVTTNVKRRRARPRPWDNYDSKINTNDERDVDVETTPLLPSRHQSIHSVKTAKRTNTYGTGRKMIHGADTSDNPSRILNGGDNIPDSNGDAYSGGFDGKYGYHSQSHLRTNDASFSMSSVITVLTVLQFILMALYNIFLHYQSHRLRVSPPYAFWFSKAGRIYNKGIGPNVPTLILFGAFHPILILQQWWRMCSALFCCTSLVEFVLNIWWFRVLGGVEEDWDKRGRGGSLTLGFIYAVSGLVGGLVYIIFSSTTDIMPTGLTGAGVTGCMTAIAIRDLYFGMKSRKRKENQRSKLCTYDNITFAHVAIIMEILCGVLLPYTCLYSIVAGILMGLCCGLCLLVVEEDWADAESQSSSMASDLEEAFSPQINTPPRYRDSIYNYNDSPPPPPSSSSKGMDTPIMRRSILTSPDEDDEFDLVESLNKSGMDGLKQRNVKMANKSLRSDIIHESNRKFPRHTGGNWYSEDRLRYIGMFSSLLLISLPVLYIGLVFKVPNDQTVTDSLYGCKTMYGLYEYSEVVDNTDDGEKVQNNDDKNSMVSNGVTICGEICIPYSIYDNVIQRGDEGISSIGSCSTHGYNCNYSSDDIDLGPYQFDRELYTQKCDQNQNAN